ncbi:MAG: PAS domain-containing sensor histidine kinase [Pseudomonadota bacterium]
MHSQDRPPDRIQQTLSLHTSQQLQHDLSVHQAELEAQNVELRNVHAALEASRARYVDLYDLAPAGYVTVDAKGLIQHANFCSASLLGTPRSTLQGKPFNRFVHKDHQDAYYHLRNQFVSSADPTTCELHMVREDGTELWVQCVVSAAINAVGSPEMRLVLVDITERKRQEQERLCLFARVEELSRSLVQAQEQARLRFSRELHERTSPNLAALRINLDFIAAASPAAHATRSFSDRLADTRALIEDTTLSIREICADLHPPVLDSGGLLGAVHCYADQFARRTGLQVQVDCPHGSVRWDSDLELALFRIVQEALTNAAKHAQARSVWVALQLEYKLLRLAVWDDGLGFDTRVAARTGRRTGLGLLNMRDTAEFAGGTFRLQSEPGKGTRIDVEIMDKTRVRLP